MPIAGSILSPFRLRWSQQITEMEGVPLDMADVHVYIIYVKTLTRDAIHENKDIENINWWILDTAGNFDNMGDANNTAPNLGQRKRTALFSASQTLIIMDKCNSTFFNDGNNYLPSIHEFKLKFVRAINHVISMIDKGGGGNSNFNGLANNNLNTLNATVDNMKVKISHFKLLLKYVESNNMIK